MGMICSLQMRAQVIQELQICGGMTESIFPQAEAWLLVGSDHQKSLDVLARYKNADKYQSVMDFLFCELFTEYRKACFKFYESDGPMLKDIINNEQLVRFNDVLLKALELAYEYFCEKRRMSWRNFKNSVFKIAA